MLHWIWLLWLRGGEIATLAICLWALWRGGTPERIGALIILVGWALTDLLSPPNQGPGPWSIVVDIAALIAFAWLALWSRRPWTYFAAACQLNGVFSHFAHKFTTFGLYSYATTIALWSGYGLIICLAGGMIARRRDKKQQLSTGQNEILRS